MYIKFKDGGFDSEEYVCHVLCQDDEEEHYTVKIGMFSNEQRVTITKRWRIWVDVGSIRFHEYFYKKKEAEELMKTLDEQLKEALG